MKTIVYNGMLVTMNENLDMYPEGYVAMEGSRVTETGSMEQLRQRYGDFLPEKEGREEEIRWEDAGGGIIMPGMVNTHCHMSMIPFRGLGDDCRDRLRVFLLPMEEKAMDRELAALAARYGICELLLAGVTTVMDMYYYAEDLAGVMDSMGIRGIAGETVMDQATCDAKTPEEAVELGLAAMKKYRDNPRVSVCLSPHGTTTCAGSIWSWHTRKTWSTGFPSPSTWRRWTTRCPI